MLNEIREWVMLASELYICWILTKEYFYDFEKDLKKQRKTRTTKKTTSLPGGDVIVEENTETIESKHD